MFEGDSALCRHLSWKISIHVDGKPSGGSCMRRPGSEDPHWLERNFFIYKGTKETYCLTNITVCTKTSCIFNVILIFLNLKAIIVDKLITFVSKQFLSLSLRNLDILVFLKMRSKVEKSRWWSSLRPKVSGTKWNSFSWYSNIFMASLPIVNGFKYTVVPGKWCFCV